MKNIIIAGAGQVGRYTAQVLTELGHTVTVIDRISARLSVLEEQLGVRTITGSVCNTRILKQADVQSCDLFLAATSSDEVNLLSASQAKKLHAQKTIARVHDPAFKDNPDIDYCNEFGIDALIFPEEQTAKSIYNRILDPSVLGMETFARGHILMRQYEVTDDSPCANTKLLDLELPMGLRVVTVKKQNRFAVIAQAKSTLEVGDVITLIGREEYFAEVSSLFRPHKVSLNEVVILGGKKVEHWLLAELKQQRFSVRLFEPNTERAEELAKEFPHITVLNADPIDSHIFEEEQLTNLPVFIAAGDDFGHNIIAAIKAKQNGAQHTVAVIQDSELISTLEAIGVDYPVSPRVEATEELLRFIDDSPVKVLSELERGNIRLYEFTVSDGAKFLDVPLIDIPFKSGAFIVAIERDKEVFSPKANDTLQVGDVVLAVGRRKSQKSFYKMFVA